MAKVEDKNGFWFIEHNPITKTGVYDYLGKQISPECEPNKIYKVLRPKEELFKKETLDSLRLIPIVNDHTMIGTGFTAPEDKGIDGTLGDNVSHDTDTIYNDLKIMSNSMKEDIRNGKKELSLGYFCRYDKQPGTYKGQRYDYIQRDIKANHLALVDKGRMGADVRVYDSKTFAMDSIDIAFDREFKESDVNRDKNGRFATKGSSFNSTEKYGQAKHKEFEKEVEKLNSMEGVTTNKGETEGQEWTAYYKNGNEHFATVNHTKREIYRNKEENGEGGENGGNEEAGEKKDDSLEINGTVLLNTGFKKNTDNTYSKQYEDGTKVTVHKQKDKRVGEYHVAEIIKENGEKSLRLFMSPNTPFVIEQLKKDYKEKETQGGDMALDDENIEWITVKGTHIPIKKGESKEQAVKNFLEGKKQSSGNNEDKDREYRNKLFKEATKRVEEKEKNKLQKESEEIQKRQSERKDNENLSFKDKLFRDATKKVEQKRMNEIEAKLGKQSGNKAELKKDDKVRFADTQGVEYKFVGESRGMLEFENIDDDSDKKGFPKGQLEERLKDGSMQISGSNSEPEKSEWDKERDKENERHEKLMIKLKKEIEEATDPEEKRDLIEHRRGMIKEHNRRLDQIFEDEEKSQKAGNSEPEEKLNDSQKMSARAYYKKEFKKDKSMHNSVSEKSIHELYNDLRAGKFDYQDYGDDSLVRERIFDAIARIEGVDYEDVYQMWLKNGEKGAKKKGIEFSQKYKQKHGIKAEDSKEYKKTQGEDSMAELKKEKPVLDEDKRKLIDEIGGILKGKLSEEEWRTIIGKAEKLAYNGSEAGKGTDEGEEVEEEFIEEEEGKEKAGKDCGKKRAAKDKCGKDKDEDEVEVEEEDEDEEEVINKKEVEKKGMDENDVIRVIARKDRLGRAVAKVIGTFDYSEMTEQQVAKYACDKLDLPVKKGEEITGINCYLKSLPKERIIFSYGMDSSSKEDAEFEKFQNKGE